MKLNFLTLVIVYVLFIIGISIILEFIKEEESYVDITNYELKKTLADFKDEYKQQFLQGSNNNNDDNYEKEVLKKAQTKLASLGDYNIVHEQTNFKNLDERFNNFQVGTKSVDFFKENPYDNLYYLNK